MNLGDAFMIAARRVQSACDRCTQGVMDANNDHLWGRCVCPCHDTEILRDLNTTIDRPRRERRAR